MCEFISQQVRLHECLTATRKKTHTRTDLEEKIQFKDVLQIETGHTYFKYTHKKSSPYLKENRFKNLNANRNHSLNLLRDVTFSFDVKN